MLQFVDSHCHLDLVARDLPVDNIIAGAVKNGVAAMIVPAIAAHNFAKVSALCAQFSQVHAAFGLHPYFIHAHKPSDLSILADCLSAANARAVGEFGLDFMLEDTDIKMQQFYFQAQLEIAKQLDKPVILHVRKAHDAVLKALRQVKLPRGGIVHAFAGSWQQAQQYIDLGFVLGFGGAMTYHRANKINKLARELDINYIVLETDAPDMAPAFIEKGSINKPEYLPQIAAYLAKIREQSLATIAQQTTANCERILGGKLIGSALV